ncbi:uncharacterized protein G2W53_017599 [Senna tora]|uniref:Uncharacterized protein n=1 Tax=Senna tora TaxID=362788 RepID=A0A834TUF4_9FABA|nr:uncharacterized protein G2W53_017599 [Senna tora]
MARLYCHNHHSECGGEQSDARCGELGSQYRLYPNRSMWKSTILKTSFESFRGSSALYGRLMPVVLVVQERWRCRSSVDEVGIGRPTYGFKKEEKSQEQQGVLVNVEGSGVIIPSLPEEVVKERRVKDDGVDVAELVVVPPLAPSQLNFLFLLVLPLLLPVFLLVYFPLRAGILGLRLGCLLMPLVSITCLIAKSSCRLGLLEGVPLDEGFFGVPVGLIGWDF